MYGKMFFIELSHFKIIYSSLLNLKNEISSNINEESYEIFFISKLDISFPPFSHILLFLQQQTSNEIVQDMPYSPYNWLKQGGKSGSRIHQNPSGSVLSFFIKKCCALVNYDRYEWIWMNFNGFNGFLWILANFDELLCHWMNQLRMQ